MSTRRSLSGRGFGRSYAPGIQEESDLVKRAVEWPALRIVQQAMQRARIPQTDARGKVVVGLVLVEPNTIEFYELWKH